ncbi:MULTISPECIES: 2-C-methyl-D-erythritol 2,4-cyclodiphosphate synthase [unclassified Enterococcus]|uniref:2-C-methyl-D-erythritol 2,4-cyclodiphosphate synthase n=1 Tax=unclassified Enterococcus TaxID=2608891 RepID=UPI001551D102|nr:MULTISPECIES: 2-C-methyl-D-erythritol 2,4-cyclodiphosphate synthase [unclassified Enterococcus]MBS7578213.1 2-C-methyl-D-erythritol 2,4-cyclodiphosphate synthase [Enterococcus sp. MMGLQ5-2]MBS7585411.1 2-C-methyl-D-erythritol 2,4-cyclodiphosphate synthase [Enterococcus sp. MMGLQ5-1]NPD13268.1 2-C-methyl-D-erythritol 2,4-cyclodiphosphate synthase [Enterococcus sp. MMGLQ5-1]NPD38044.1 2-C-methyl-D-erythritol 2,4-cyclodiphosphate synthase [Enterococcus sp. MMGLQ5-2]
MFRIGQGYDVHQLVDGRRLMIGGEQLPFEQGLLGHSDADVLLHAITDAIIGALGAGDIGHAFPDTDQRTEGISSTTILSEIFLMMSEKGYQVSNIDSTIIAERPKMAAFLPKMKQNIADILQISAEQVNIKATTSEKMGFIGRGEGIGAQAVVLLKKNENF